LQRGKVLMNKTEIPYIDFTEMPQGIQ